MIDPYVHERVAALIFEAYRAGGKVMICGNGGLAAESEHFAAELMGTFAQAVYIPCVSLTANSSLVTALANDMGFEDVFAHQVKVLGSSNDLLIAMTTSKSENIVRALEAANLKDMGSVCICSERASLFADVVIQVPGKDAAKVQDGTIKFLHQLAAAAKRRVYVRTIGCQPEQPAADAACSR